MHNVDTNIDCVSQYIGNADCETLTDETVFCKHNNGSCVNLKTSQNMVKTSEVSINMVKTRQCIKAVYTQVDANETNVSDNSFCKQKRELTGSGNICHSTARRRHSSIICVPDKYELDLRFRPHHRNHIAAAHHWQTFRL